MRAGLFFAWGLLGLLAVGGGAIAISEIRERDGRIAELEAEVREKDASRARGVQTDLKVVESLDGVERAMDRQEEVEELKRQFAVIKGRHGKPMTDEERRQDTEELVELVRRIEVLSAEVKRER